MLYATHTHCAHCGAKWIEKRITMRNVAADFGDLYIGLDTKFMHTFVDLFRKPEAVILGYVQGRRMYYMDAVRYLLLSLFITGIYVFVLKQTNVMEDYMADSILTADTLANYSDEQIEAQQKFASKFLDYQGLLLLFTIPFLALVGRISFWGRKFFNYTEHVVFFLYVYAHMIIFTTPISILLAYLSPEIFLYWSYLALAYLLFHSAQSYKRCFQLTIAETILRSLIALIVFVATAVLLMLVFIFTVAITVIVASKMGYDLSGFLPAQT
ncbi:DUF3667 domain-containing protein [Nonlabens ponticola]|nr:DUF3667 domain-containing protein [Nonlabens ponticola]